MDKLLVNRLRGNVGYLHKQLCLDAAAEIERLNISHKELIIEREIKNEQIANMRAEIERLQAALDDECAAHKVCVEMREEEEGAWEYWHQRARQLEAALAEMLADLDDPDMIEISAATIARARQVLAAR